MENKIVRRLNLIIIISIFCLSNMAFSEESHEYSPYPIIFVHGYNARETKDWERWKETKTNLQKYFFENNQYKYSALDSKEKYFPLVNYGNQKTGLISRNGDIPAIAIFVLRPAIEWAINNCFPSDYPQEERKVIVVAHSMGGLVVRALINYDSSYKDKIHRVVFVNVPHQGSPYPSALWMVNKEANEILPPLIKDYKQFYAIPIGNMASCLSDRRKAIYDDIKNKLKDRYNRDKQLLWIAENLVGTDPDGFAIDKMRLPFHSEYHDEIITESDYYKIRVPIDITYEPNQTYLGLINLAVPSNFKVIRGAIPEEVSDTDLVLNWVEDLLNRYRGGHPLGFLFREGYSLNDIKLTGDGVVPKLSQETVGDVVRTDYLITASHGSAPDNWQPILQAIEDDPVIESVYAVPVDWNATPNDDSYNRYYLIFKVKDYLLADIEIDTLTIDGVSIKPESFKGSDGKYKPYNALKQTFLKERICNGENGSELIEYTDIQGNVRKDLKLKPGEFSIRAPMPLSSQSLYIKIKNPAAQYNTDNPNKFITEKTLYFYAPKVSGLWINVIDVPPYRPLEPYDPDSGPYPPEPWPQSTPLYFTIQDSPTQDVRLNVWLYNEGFQDIPRKFATAYTTPIPWTSSRNETLPDGQTTITLHTGVFDSEHLFATWYGENDSGGTVPPHTNYEGSIPYYLKVTVGPSDVNSNDNLIFLLGSGIAGTAADPTFIQPSRRESVTW